MQQRYGRLRAIFAQLLMAKPTRAGLAWSAALPLTPYSDVEQELARCEGVTTVEDRAPLASLGDACLMFRAEHHLPPLSMDVDASAGPAHSLAARRLLLNDILHVVLCFDADWAGQLGVFSFVAAQSYCPQFEWQARTLGQVYMTAAPWLRDALGTAEYRGRQLAMRAPRLLTMPLEQEWRTSLLALQIQLKLKRERRLLAIDWRTPALPAIRAA